MAQKRRKPIIGVLVSGITDDFTEQLCLGVLEAAKTLDVTVVTMPGKYLDRDFDGNWGILYEYQHNTIFSYARPDNVDAILVAADCIGCLTTRDRLKRLMETYRGIPTVLMASRLEGYPNISYDNITGIRDGMEYLIHSIGCRHFGMIGGPDDNFDATERKQIFFQVLEEHNIEFRPEAYIQGGLIGCTPEEYDRYLDLNPDLEAVICVNDHTAISFYDALLKRGIVPGKDIAVLGFDDTIDATRVEPPLSSVSASPAALGHQALLAILQVLNGKRAENITLPTKFIRRKSFFDTPLNERGSEAPVADLLNPNNIFEEIFYRYNHDVYRKEIAPLREACKNLANSVMLRFSNDGQPAPSNSEIMSYLEDFLNAGAAKYANIDSLLDVFQRGYQLLAYQQPNMNKIVELQDVFTSIYRNIIRSIDHQMGDLDERTHMESNSMKLFVQDSITFEKGNDQSYAQLLNHLYWLNIENAFLYTFENPIMHLNREQFHAPEQFCLKAVLLKGEVSVVPVLKQTVPLEELFCNSFMDPNERYHLVLLPLYSNEFLYGLLLCDLADSIYENGDFLCNQMGAATKMLHLLLSNEQIQQQLEENLVTLRENNIVLDALSKSDVLTGILNRRGFEDSAEQLLDLNRQSGKDTLAIYVDMNNLKIINDRYGHEEGDFSLHLIAETLSTIMKNSGGLAGRIGGDEFACVLTHQGTDRGEDFIRQIYDAFDTFNKNSSKSYNVTVSAGGCLIEADSELSLAQALKVADEQLYHAKRLRTKEVEKKRAATD